MQEESKFLSKDEFKHFFDNHMKVLTLVQKNFQDARNTRELLQQAVEIQNKVYSAKIQVLADKIFIKQMNELKEKNKKLRLQNKNLKSLLMNKGKQ